MTRRRLGSALPTLYLIFFPFPPRTLEGGLCAKQKRPRLSGQRACDRADQRTRRQVDGVTTHQLNPTPGRTDGEAGQGRGGEGRVQQAGTQRRDPPPATLEANVHAMQQADKDRGRGGSTSSANFTKLGARVADLRSLAASSWKAQHHMGTQPLAMASELEILPWLPPRHPANPSSAGPLFPRPASPFHRAPFPLFPHPSLGH
jgi:hypothetical protein